MKNLIVYSILILFFSSHGQNLRAISGGESKLIASNTDIKFINKSSSEKNQTKECSPSKLRVYLNNSNKSGTNIRKTPKGDIVTKLILDDANYFYFIILTEAKNGWFKIESPIQSAKGDIKIPNGEGWIHGSVISVDTRNYEGQHLNLLDKPKGKKVIKVIKEEEIGLRLKDLCGEWVKVECNGTIGWIESKWLCGNNLTNCSCNIC